MESGISAGGAGMFGIPAGGAGMLALGYANKRTVAISMGAPSVFESMVPDKVCCAISGMAITLHSMISRYFIYNSYL